MKTLIFSGTPRKNGDTMALINEFIKYLDGEYKIVDALFILVLIVDTVGKMMAAV